MKSSKESRMSELFDDSEETFIMALLGKLKQCDQKRSDNEVFTIHFVISGKQHSTEQNMDKYFNTAIKTKTASRDTFQNQKNHWSGNHEKLHSQESQPAAYFHSTQQSSVDTQILDSIISNQRNTDVLISIQRLDARISRIEATQSQILTLLEERRSEVNKNDYERRDNTPPDRECWFESVVDDEKDNACISMSHYLSIRKKRNHELTISKSALLQHSSHFIDLECSLHEDDSFMTEPIKLDDQKYHLKRSRK